MILILRAQTCPLNVDSSRLLRADTVEKVDFSTSTTILAALGRLRQDSFGERQDTR
jgi:hypothetical protein